MSMDWLLKMFVLDCGLRFLGGPPDLPHQSIGAVWHSTMHSWRVASLEGSKWDDSEISGASLFCSDSTKLWKAAPQQKLLKINTEDKIFFCKKNDDGIYRSIDLDLVRVVHLTNEDSILVKRKPYPLPPYLSSSPCNNTSYEKFPHNSSQNYTRPPIYELYPYPTRAAIVFQINAMSTHHNIC